VSARLDMRIESIRGAPQAALVAAALVSAIALSGLATAEPLPPTMPPLLLEVGPGRALATPSAAARVARDGATVAIDEGDYIGDVAVWTQNRLTIRGVGGRARLQAGGRSAEGKAIWVIRGDGVLIEHFELSGTRVPDHNGAGIRHEGGSLRLRDCRLHHNEMGILTYNERRGELAIEDCEVDNNTTETEVHGKLGHNIYVGRIGRFSLRNSYVHDARIGHLVKSRAAVSSVRENRLIDGLGASYLIDFSDGGAAEVVGNRMEKSAAAPNRTAIAYGPESSASSDDPLAAGRSLTVERNSYSVAGSPGTFVRNHLQTPVLLLDNRLPARVTPLRGEGESR
jgi:hypothetical protein